MCPNRRNIIRKESLTERRLRNIIRLKLYFHLCLESSTLYVRAFAIGTTLSDFKRKIIRFRCRSTRDKFVSRSNTLYFDVFTHLSCDFNEQLEKTLLCRLWILFIIYRYYLFNTCFFNSV